MYWAGIVALGRESWNPHVWHGDVVIVPMVDFSHSFSVFRCWLCLVDACCGSWWPSVDSSVLFSFLGIGSMMSVHDVHMVVGAICPVFREYISIKQTGTASYVVLGSFWFRCNRLVYVSQQYPSLVCSLSLRCVLLVFSSNEVDLDQSHWGDIASLMWWMYLFCFLVCNLYTKSNTAV